MCVYNEIYERSTETQNSVRTFMTAALVYYSRISTLAEK